MIILVVTDNVQLFDLIPEMIEQVFPGSEAYGSIRAEDAFSALSSRMRFDQVWSDLDLNSKEFTGIDVLVRAKKESPGAKTVLMSGNFNKADVVKRIGLGGIEMAKQQGIDETLQKPFGLKEIKQLASSLQ